MSQALQQIIPLTQGLSAIIDADDFERELTCRFRDGFIWSGRLCDVSWYANRNRNTYYAVARLGSRRLAMHRVVACAGERDLVDHKDRNGLHNWRENLRLANETLNNANSLCRVGRWGYRGVCRFDGTKTFSARIMVRGKYFYAHGLSTPEEAAHAYDRLAIVHFGEFAQLNFPSTPTREAAV